RDPLLPRRATRAPRGARRVRRAARAPARLRALRRSGLEDLDLGALAQAGAAALHADGVTAMEPREAKLRELFARLASATSAHEAGAVEREIWSAWHETNDAAAAPWMQRGLAAIEARDLITALAAFDRVTELAPDYAEGWNKRATVHWLRGAL